ncbi:MAG TPA: ABC transporter permease [Spirochaetia bacterium]|nr:ABC transporter permease [Spirochaetia bacterium]
MSAPFLRRAAVMDAARSLAAFVLALAVGAVIIALMGVDPLRAYAALIDGAVGNRNSLGETLLRSIPLGLAGVGVSIAFRAGAFNVGAEGQLFVGAMASAWVGLSLPGLPPVLLLAVMGLAAMLAGAAWAGIAGVLKAAVNANEMINTIMLNYVAVLLVSWLVHGPLKDPGSPLGQTARLPRAGYLPVILPGTRLHAGLILLAVAAVVAALALARTAWGFRIRVVGTSTLVARASGMRVNRVTVGALALSGMLAGLAGFCEAAGVQHRMIESISPGYGYTAIVVALLGQTSPLGVLVAAVLFAALQIGASTMESAVHVPSSVITVIQYLVVLLLIGRGAVDLARSRLGRIGPRRAARAREPRP